MSGATAPEAIAVTVTFLEMTAPPATLSASAGEPAGRAAEDAQHAAAFLSLPDGPGRPEMALGQCAADERRGTGRQASQRRTATSASSISTARRPASSTSSRICRKTVELAYFGMMEHATGQGHRPLVPGCGGRGGVVAAARAVSVQTCTLDHPAALPLYQKLGFSPVGQKQEKVWPMSFEQRSESVMRE